MRIDGKWLLCDDAIVRPVVSGEILSADGRWLQVEFLLDPAADRTVLSAQVLANLKLVSSMPSQQLGGVGGQATSVLITTAIRMYRDDGVSVLFRGQFAAFTDPAALDMSVLGRDILNLFAVIVDRPGDIVCLIGQRHRYTITQI
jgi:hypothetical protein